MLLIIRTGLSGSPDNSIVVIVGPSPSPKGILEPLSLFLSLPFAVASELSVL